MPAPLSPTSPVPTCRRPRRRAGRIRSRRGPGGGVLAEVGGHAARLGLSFVATGAVTVAAHLALSLVTPPA